MGQKDAFSHTAPQLPGIARRNVAAEMILVVIIIVGAIRYLIELTQSARQVPEIKHRKAPQ